MKKIAMVVGEDFWLRIPMNNESAGRHLCMDDVEVIHAWLESGYGGCWTLPLETDGEQLEGVAVKVPGSRLGLGTYAVVMAGKFVNGGHFRTKRQLFIRLVDREEQADAKPTMFNEEKAYWAGPAVLSGMLSRDGLNTYELAVLHGYDGTLEQFLAQAGIELQDLMVTKAKLSREVQTQLDKGSEKAINPAGDYDAEAEYSVNEMVYDEVTNSSYVSKQSVNVGHAVTDTDWWMKVLDGNYVHTTIQAIMTAAQATLDEAKQDTIDATAAALAAKQATEQATIAANAVAAQKVADAQIGYYVCETAAGTATKQTTSDVIGEDHFAVPYAGGAVKVSMKYANTSTDAVYLQFGTNTNTKRKLYYNGEAASNSNTWDDGEVISVYLDPAANNGAGGYMASNAQGGSNKKVDELGDELAIELTYDMADRTIPYHITKGGAWEANNYHQAFFKVKKRDVIVITKGTNNAMFALLTSIDTSVAPVFMTGHSNRVSILTSTPKTIVVPEDGWLFVYGWNTGHDTNYWPASVVKKWGGMDKVADFGVNNNNAFSEIPLPELTGYTRIAKTGLFETTTNSTFGVRVYDVSAYHGKRIKIGGVLYRNECPWSIGETADFDDASEITRVGYFVGESYPEAHFREYEIILGDDENYIAVGSYFGSNNTSGYVPYVKVMIPADEAIDKAKDELNDVIDATKDKLGYPHLVTENIPVDLSTRTKIVSSETGDIVPSPSGSITYFVSEIPIDAYTEEISFKAIAFSGNYGVAFLDADNQIVFGFKTYAGSGGNIPASGIYTIKKERIETCIADGAVKVRISSTGVDNPVVVKSYPKPIDNLYNKVDTTNDKIIGHDFGDYKPLIGSKTLYIPQSIDTSEITSEEYDIFKRGATRSAEQLDNLYGLYDALAAAHPQFFKEVVEDPVRKDQSSTYDIRRYRLGFLYPIANANRSGVGTNQYDESATGHHKRRRLLFEMGIHAAEDMAMLGGYLAIKAILESNEPWAVFIKSNFVIDILPCSNPYGFVNNSSRNVNNINLNRTFYDNTSVDENDRDVRLQRQAENNHIIDIIQELKPLGLIGTISPHNTSNGSNDNCGYFVSRKSYKYWDYYVMLSQNISALEFHLFKSVFGGTKNNYFHCWDTTGESDAKGQMHMYVDGESLLGCTFEIQRLADDSVEMTKKEAMLTKITAINIIQAFGSYY